MKKHAQDENLRVEGTRYSGIVIVDDEILLMFRRKDGRQYYTLPGGHKRRGELDNETVRREIFEETGIRVEVGQIVLDFKNDFTNQQDKIFLCSAKKKTRPRLLGEEKDYSCQNNYYKPMWVRVEEASNLINMYPEEARNWLMSRNDTR
ncbi:MAG: NUDIX domain-containing protein [Candidatus Dojkabacteria bacterium]|nr:NUDIX domain-containing protein [Candidatus Dojkabacteria bacterium]